MRYLLLILTLMILTSFSLNEKDGKEDERILIINSFNAHSINARKNKRELFAELADSLRYMLKNELDRTQSSYSIREVIIIPEFVTNIQGNDSVYTKFINGHLNTRIIVIRDLNAFFTQTGVEVTKDASGKRRVASFDINADIVYDVYNENGLLKEFKTQAFEFFTERNVMSGLLAGGPDIVGKKKHAFKIVQKNAEQFIREMKLYFQKE